MAQDIIDSIYNTLDSLEKRAAFLIRTAACRDCTWLRHKPSGVLVVNFCERHGNINPTERA